MLVEQQIKKLRVQAGLTQQQLADASGLSQSLVAKIEHGTVDPLYSTIQKLQSALSNYKQHLPSLQSISKNKLVFCTQNEKIKAVLSRLKTTSVSQLPVFDGDIVIGIVSESSLLNALLENRKSLTDALLPPPPIIPMQTSTQVVAELLKSCEIVLVSQNGKVCGIVSRADLLILLAKSI